MLTTSHRFLLLPLFEHALLRHSLRFDGALSRKTTACARQELLDEHEQQPCPKRRKADTTTYSRSFWYTLSTVTLTRRALAEFDRRTAATRHPIRGEVKPPAKSRILRSDTSPLRAFVSRGVPDLSELRGVGGLEPFQCKTALMITAVFRPSHRRTQHESIELPIREPQTELCFQHIEEQLDGQN